MKVVALAGVAGLLLFAAAGVSRGLSAPPNGDVLPDLIQRVPYDLTVTRAGDRFLLGFASAVSNVGEGPLIVQAERRSRAVPAMRARRSEEHTSELQSLRHLVCRRLL